MQLAFIIVARGIDWVWFEDELKFRPVHIDTYMGQGVELSGK
jgi:hypothetical protein